MRDSFRSLVSCPQAEGEAFGQESFSTVRHHLDVVCGIVEQSEYDGQHLLAVVQYFRLTVLRELPKAEARALPHVRTGVERQLCRLQMMFSPHAVRQSSRPWKKKKEKKQLTLRVKYS